jgi:hypothetical protein
MTEMFNTLSRPHKKTSSRESNITRNAIQEIDVTNKKRRCWVLPGNRPTVSSSWQRVQTAVRCPARRVYRNFGFDPKSYLVWYLLWKNEHIIQRPWLSLQLNSWLFPSSAGTATGYGLGGRHSNPGRRKIFLCSTTSRPALGSTQPHI